MPWFIIWHYPVLILKLFTYFLLYRKNTMFRLNKQHLVKELLSRNINVSLVIDDPVT